MRKSEIKRTSLETDVSITLNLDGNGTSEINTGVGFLDHMLTLFSRHGKFDLSVYCKGDICVDDHHSVEDIGIVLGKAFKESLGNKEGICRYATNFTPMDETLVQTSVDISGRPYLVFNVDYSRDKVGTFDTELVEEFFRAFSNHANITLHINLIYGKNTHHIIEAIFKGVGRTLYQASQIDGNEILSTKGIMD